MKLIKSKILYLCGFLSILPILATISCNDNLSDNKKNVKELINFYNQSIETIWSDKTIDQISDEWVISQKMGWDNKHAILGIWEPKKISNIKISFDWLERYSNKIKLRLIVQAYEPTWSEHKEIFVYGFSPI